MKPVLCFPLHDIDGTSFYLLEKIIPDLKKHFLKTIISLSPQTLIKQEGRLKNYYNDDFFLLTKTENHYKVGDQVYSLFETAVNNFPKNQLLHYCSADRLSFALLTKYKAPFLRDALWAQRQNKPIIFIRSKKAWQTHPKNYYAIESMVTNIGETIFGKTLDFCWAHGTIKIDLLKKILPKIKASDWTIVCKYVIELRKLLINKEVDWLSWEDPFVLNINPKELKKQRENDEKEVEKRLGYAIPMIKTILKYQ